MVRVLAVSDEVDDALVADPTAVRGAQLILACGDLPFEYLGSLMNALDVPLVFVPGNHDPDVSGYRSSRAGLTLKAGLPARPPWPAPSTPTAGSSTWPACGWPGSAEAGATATGRTSTPTGSRPGAPGRCEAGRGGAGQRDGRGVDVLLTHAPPRGVGDGDDPPHRGFGGLRGLVAALQPAALLHGHVHPYGAHVRLGRLGRTAVFNVTGWHLLELEPGAGLAELLPGRRHA